MILARRTQVMAALAAVLAMALFAWVVRPMIVQAQTPVIQLLNPSAYGQEPPEISDKENPYHFVAWVANPPQGAVVRFRMLQGETNVPVGTATQDTPDTWSLKSVLPTAVDDGTAIVRALLLVNDAVQGQDDREVVVNRQRTGAARAETVEITSPVNGGTLQFNGGTATIVVDPSSGADAVIAYYTLSIPGTEPQWVRCGEEEDPEAEGSEVECELEDGHAPASVRGVAAIAAHNVAAFPPAPCEPSLPPSCRQNLDSGDAHRVQGVDVTPTPTPTSTTTTTPTPTPTTTTTTSPTPTPTSTTTPSPAPTTTTTSTTTPTQTTSPGDTVQGGPCRGYPPNSTTPRDGGGGMVVVGTHGDDLLDGGEGDDIICGLGGNDTIRGLGGDDSIYGGRGADTIRGGPGEDILVGGGGHDILRGGGGPDIMRGNRGNDTMRGGRGPDILQGGRGHDVLFGGRGHDTLRGGRGHDELYGGRGNDILTGGGGNDLCRGGPGNNRLRRCNR